MVNVFRFHPPLIYGRRGDADNGEGISLARVINYVINMFISIVEDIYKLKDVLIGL